MSMREEKLDFWKSNGKNVLLVGQTGVGKTQMLLSAMSRRQLSLDDNVAQWSSALVDFVGPGVEKADLLFFDDFGDEKSVEAANEVLSLRRWKGNSIKPTAVIWACHTIPWIDSYKYSKNFEQKFDVVVLVPNKINTSYFEGKFGKRVADIAIHWWNEEHNQTECPVTPRRLEQAIDMWLVNGDMRDVLPLACNVNKLLCNLNTAAVKKKLLELMEQDEATRQVFFANENNCRASVQYICESDAMMRAFLPLFSVDAIKTAFNDRVYGDKVAAFVVVQSKDVRVYEDAVHAVLQEDADKRLVDKFRRILSEMSQGLLTVSETTQH